MHKRSFHDDKVGYLGLPGSFSHAAARRFFPKGTELHGYKTCANLVAGVSHGKCTYGTLPLENSVSGSVVKNYDLLHSNTVTIVGEVYLRIRQNLLAYGKISPQALTTIYSHPEAFNQCDEYLRSLKIKRVEVDDTATAANFIANRGKHYEAAIASLDAAKRYGLKVLKKDIQTNKANYSRFIIIAKEKAANGKKNKASLTFTLKHQPGTLYRTLGALAGLYLNLTKIESRPILGKPFEYLFYLDFEFTNGQDADDALSKMQKYTASLRILGLYEKGKRYEK